MLLEKAFHYTHIHAHTFGVMNSSFTVFEKHFLHVMVYLKIIVFIC